ncbi:WXG100 family type VII secretion target [Streptomyces roseolus]|uniref:WXG100 family type VII secretion target n=1 Tax=Streptomyces roseolus TaxID=67358 RepID=UPI0036634339
MSEEKSPNTNTAPPPNLTPQEQQQAKDTAQIEAKHETTDFLEKLDDIRLPFPFGGDFRLRPKGSVYGETSFEGHKLNAMLDLLDSADPSQLSTAGDALQTATKELNAAAKALTKFVGSVDWEGDAAVEFQRYGSEVANYAWAIGKVANAVGSQMKVANDGLTSVRNAAPPRDTRADQRKPSEFSELEKTEKKEEYQKAVAVEKDRQEAINQMNRLASFYAVSQSTLAAQEMPKPPEAYRAPVPPPTGGVRIDSSGGSATGSSRDGLSRETSGRISAVEDRTTPTMPRTGDQLDGSDPIREKPSDDTRVQIDTVKTPPAPTLPNTAPTPTAPTNTAPPTGPGMPPPLTLGTPPRATGPKITGNPGVPRTTTGRTGFGRPVGPTTAPAVGRAGGPKGPIGPQAFGRSSSPTNSPVVGRPGNPTSSPMAGRPGTPTNSPATGRANGPMGRAGGPQATSQSTPAGRATSQTGRPGQPATGRTAGGKASPIMGGTPQRTTGGNTGSRIPRGTVVGSEGPAAGRTAAARPSQAGVVGANNAKAAPRPAGRGTPSSNGVVGTPRGMAGRGSQRPDRDEQDRDGSSRPDYLTEDEETWTNRRRGAVPPVID